jgi:pimeloyl-ACP methyl ester carboxylesterase
MPWRAERLLDRAALRSDRQWWSGRSPATMPQLLGPASRTGCEMTMSKSATIKADFLEGGSGPLVMLVHSSVCGARQWRRLMDDLKGDFRVRAVNLYGYGKTPPWSADLPQSLDDQARLVETALPTDAETVFLVGHCFGGSVAMTLHSKSRRGRRVHSFPAVGA